MPKWSSLGLWVWKKEEEAAHDYNSHSLITQESEQAQKVFNTKFQVQVQDSDRLLILS